MTQFTPGPWGADHCTEHRIKDDPGHWQIDGPTPMGLNNTMPYTVADTSNRNYCISPEEDRANALLIAAAPDLLAALEGMIQAWSVQFENEMDGCPEAVAAMAARKKARG